MARSHEILHSGGEISSSVREGQIAMFDLAARKHGFTLKRLHLETDIPESTLRGWIAGTSVMPIDGLVKLAMVKGFPNSLLSLPLECAAKSIHDDGQDEADIDNAVLAAAQMLLRYVEARHPESASGIAIDHTEAPDLRLFARNVSDLTTKAA